MSCPGFSAKFGRGAVTWMNRKTQTRIADIPVCGNRAAGLDGSDMFPPSPVFSQGPIPKRLGLVQ